MVRNIFSSHRRSPITNHQWPANGSKGFTLLELLVVIAIIGILFSIATAAFSTAQKKARDAKRVEDMKAIQNAMEQYYAANNTYPASCLDSGDTLTIEAGNTFIIPTDPKGTPAYNHSGCSSTGYCYCATLEETTVGNADSNSCHFASSGQYYCVKNLQ